MPNLPASFAATPIPTFAFAVRLGVGPAAAPPTGMTTMLLGSRTSAGTASDHLPTEVFDVTDAEARFGARSRLTAMVRAYRVIAPRGRLYACPVADPAGTAATAILTFTGPSTAAGVVRLRIAGRLIREAVIPSGTSATAAAALVLAALAEVSELPCTGAVGGGGSEHILTLTGANTGATGNQLRVVFEVTATGITISLNGVTTAVRGKGYFGAGSATAGVGAVDLTSALAAIAGTRYHRIVADIDDDTNRGRLKTHLVNQSSINTGKRCMGVVGSLEDTLATVQGDATAQNEARLTLVYNRRSHQTAGELAAAYMAAKVYGSGALPGEEQYLAAKANGLSLYPAILATDEEERLTGTQLDALLRAGVTPLGTDNLNPGYAAVVRPVTTRTLNAQGGASYLVADTSKVAVSDAVADRCEAWAASAYADKNLVPDPASTEQAPSSPYVTWPSAVRDDLLGILRQMEAEYLIVSVSQYASQVTVEQTTIDGVTYLVCRVPFAVINHLHSVVGEAQQVA